MSQTLSERFWCKVVIGSANECWPFTGHLNKRGYGRITVGTVKQAHRVAWELCFGQIPSGKSILHHCDNPPCCNPQHLFVGDQDVNMADAAKKGRIKRKLTWGQVLQIREMAGTGLKQRIIAGHFGVAQTNVSLILRGKIWRHQPCTSF